MAMTRLMTIEEFEQMPDGGHRYELWDGELIEMAPPGETHNDVIREIVWNAEQFIRASKIEKLFIETTFVIRDDPPSSLVPDIAFIHEHRLRPDRDRRRIVGTYPDIAIEVVSPTDRIGEVMQKVARYLDAGVTLVWVVDPDSQTVTVHRLNRDMLILTSADTLDGEDILPGLRIPVSLIFSQIS
jgi:Uma2 family endonuclease